MTASTRRARSSLPTKTRARARSEATVSLAQTPDTEKEEDDSDEDSAEQLTMSPAEIRVIRRLSARANVLPVIARADSLTDDKLSAVKDAIRKDLQDAGLDFGVFGPAKAAALAKKANGHANLITAYPGDESISMTAVRLRVASMAWDRSQARFAAMRERTDVEHAAVLAAEARRAA